MARRPQSPPSDPNDPDDPGPLIQFYPKTQKDGPDAARAAGIVWSYLRDDPELMKLAEEYVEAFRLRSGHGLSREQVTSVNVSLRKRIRARLGGEYDVIYMYLSLRVNFYLREVAKDPRTQWSQWQPHLELKLDMPIYEPHVDKKTKQRIREQKMKRDDRWRLLPRASKYPRRGLPAWCRLWYLARWQGLSVPDIKRRFEAEDIAWEFNIPRAKRQIQTVDDLLRTPSPPWQPCHVSTIVLP